MIHHPPARRAAAFLSLQNRGSAEYPPLCERKQTLGLQPGHGRTNRPRPRGKYQLVIGFLKFRARLQISYRDSLAVPMNGDDLVMDVHINIKTAFEALGGLQSKQIAIFNNTADVIRQSAVGIR